MMLLIYDLCWLIVYFFVVDSDFNGTSSTCSLCTALVSLVLTLALFGTTCGSGFYYSVALALALYYDSSFGFYFCWFYLVLKWTWVIVFFVDSTLRNLSLCSRLISLTSSLYWVSNQFMQEYYDINSNAYFSRSVCISMLFSELM